MNGINEVMPEDNYRDEGSLTIQLNATTPAEARDSVNSRVRAKGPAAGSVLSLDGICLPRARADRDRRAFQPEDLSLAPNNTSMNKQQAFDKENPLSKLIYVDFGNDRGTIAGKWPWRLVDDVESILRDMSNLELHMVFVNAELQLGNEFRHLLDESNDPYRADLIVLSPWRSDGVNRTLRVEALSWLHQQADEILRERGLEPYRGIQLRSGLKA